MHYINKDFEKLNKQSSEILKSLVWDCQRCLFESFGIKKETIVLEMEAIKLWAIIFFSEAVEESAATEADLAVPIIFYLDKCGDSIKKDALLTVYQSLREITGPGTRHVLLNGPFNVLVDYLLEKCGVEKVNPIMNPQAFFKYKIVTRDISEKIIYCFGLLLGVCPPPVRVQQK